MSSLLYGYYMLHCVVCVCVCTDDKSQRSRAGQPLVMLLCRVLLGHVHLCKTPQPFQRPPCITCLQEKCVQHDAFYDSVLGVNRTNGQRLLFREFVVFEKAQLYPEFIVYYTRQK